MTGCHVEPHFGRSPVRLSERQWFRTPEWTPGGVVRRGRNRLGVALVERSVFQEQEDIRLNPETQAADGEKNTRGLVCALGLDLFEASGQPKSLHLRWQFRQQERMTDADMVLVEDCGNFIAQVGQLQSSGLCVVFGLCGRRKPERAAECSGTHVPGRAAFGFRSAKNAVSEGDHVPPLLSD